MKIYVILLFLSISVLGREEFTLDEPVQVRTLHKKKKKKQEKIKAKYKQYPIGFYQKYVEEKRISFHYRRGENLVYDCEVKHFVCANDDSLEGCEYRNNEAQFLGEKKKRCIFVKKFDEQLTCVQNLYKILEKSHADSYCYF